MFQEEVADLTAKHLRTHIEAYLQEVSDVYSDKIKLQMPKAIETANLVGGVYNTTRNKMPAYAVDIIEKADAGQTTEGLWLRNYTGHIAGIVSAESESNANALVKRHEQAVELFVNRHQFMHQMASVLGQDFTIIELLFVGAGFSGAEQVEEGNREGWIAGFRIELIWVVSEPGPDQHVS